MSHIACFHFQMGARFEVIGEKLVLMIPELAVLNGSRLQYAPFSLWSREVLAPRAPSLLKWFPVVVGLKNFSNLSSRPAFWQVLHAAKASFSSSITPSIRSPKS